MFCVRRWLEGRYPDRYDGTEWDVLTRNRPGGSPGLRDPESRGEHCGEGTLDKIEQQNWGGVSLDSTELEMLVTGIYQW